MTPDQNSPETPLNLLSAFAAIFAWITVKDLQVILTVIATCVSIVAGCCAIYLYYLKIKAKKFND